MFLWTRILAKNCKKLVEVVALIVIGRSFFKYLKAKSKSNEEQPPVEKSSNKNAAKPTKNPTSDKWRKKFKML